jgi:hypothetical protein
MENTKINEISKKNSKEDIGEKLKRAVQTYFIQLKNGCMRKLCYNPNCIKSKGKFILNNHKL